MRQKTGEFTLKRRYKNGGKEGGGRKMDKRKRESRVNVRDLTRRKTLGRGIGLKGGDRGTMKKGPSVRKEGKRSVKKQAVEDGGKTLA